MQDRRRTHSLVLALVGVALLWTGTAAAFASPSTADLQLIQVQVIHRHGDRTPTNEIKVAPVTWTCTENLLERYSLQSSPTEAVGNRLFRVEAEPGHQVLQGNCSAGQLTDIGVAQLQALGAQLRATYVEQYGLLPTQYAEGTLAVRSTAVPRAIQSAQALLSGLYPSDGGGGRDGADVVTAVPITIRDDKTEDMRINPSFCPRLDEVLAKAIANKTFALQLAATLAPVSEHVLAALHTDDPLRVLEYYDNLHCRLAHGLPLPPPLTASDMAVLAQAWNQLGQLIFPAAAFSLGSFYAQLMHNMQTVPPARFLVYSGHDTTVGPLLAALNVLDGVWPPYAAHVLLELWADGADDRFVRVLYNNHTLSVPGCPTSSDLCPLATFLSVFGRAVPPDMQKSCELVADVRSRGLFRIVTDALREAAVLIR